MNSSARLPSQTDKHLHESQSLRNSTAALRRQSRSNWSLPKISAKREFSRKRPETFGNFAPEITRCAVWRLSRTRESRDFRACEAQVAKCRQTQEWMGGAEGIEPRYGDFEIGCSCLFERSCRTPLHQNSQVSRNTRISRTVPNPQSPELWREMSHSEKKGRILPIRGPELKSEIAANTGVHYQHPRAEKRWQRRSWRRERNWGRTFST